jgi:hypothetical protein
MALYLKLLKPDRTGGWSNNIWPETGEFKRRTTREPVCGESGIWVLDSAQSALDWLNMHKEIPYCKVSLVTSEDYNPVVLTDNGRKVGLCFASVLLTINFSNLRSERDAVDAKWWPERDAVDAKWQPEYDAVDAKWRPERDAVDAKWRSERDAVNAKLLALFDALLSGATKE